MELLRRLAAWFDRKAERSAVVEECEPRILYSADVNPWLWAGAAQIRMLDEPVAETTTATAREQPAVQDASTQQVTQRTELVFIDSRVSDQQALIDDLRARADGTTRFEVVVIDRSSDGLAQIDAALAGRSGIDALHVVSHGDDGVLLLGSRTFDAAALQAHADQLSGWQAALSDDADILLYGCDVALGDGGQALLTTLAQLTRADIAASTDTTGAASNGGNWVLEAQTGAIEASVPFSAELQENWQTGLATYVVTSTADSGAGTLRQAITDANSNPGADIISFNIAGTGVHTIAPTAALPQITGQVSIDGTTDDSYAANSNRPAIELNGTSAGAVDGLVLAAGSDGSTIRGLVVQNFNQSGILVQSTGNTIAGNYIGLDADGTTVSANNFLNALYLGGIRVESNNNTIGGLSAADRNVISGNGYAGIVFVDASANQVLGNYIGTDAGGTLDRGNEQEGIDINRGDSNIVGGANVNARNIISGNDSDGIEIDGSVNNVVQGNYIGTDYTGTLDLGNARDGIDVNEDAGNGATGNLLGGAGLGEGNLIFGNDINGIEIRDTSTTGNAVLGNRIFGNAALGIELGTGDGVTANDAPGTWIPTDRDPDTGPNNLQNFPVLTSAVTTGTQITITGTINSTASTTFRIEFFASTAADGTGYGEGQTYLGFANVITDSSGNATINGTLTANVAVGAVISATATNSTTNDSSEFALNIAAVAANTAPTLGTGTLASVAEDTASPAGQSVGTIFAGQFSDPDAGSSFGGIAVVGNTATALTQGIWQYSTNAGSNWFAIGTVADGASALALSSSTLIRFVPVADYNGTPPALTVRGLDNTYVAGYSTTAGSETRVNVNTTSNGGMTAIAAVSASLSTSITAVNDAPVAADDRPSLSFDGVDDYVSVPDSASLTMGSTMTLEAWINPDFSSNSVQMIANKEGEYELAIFADGSLNFAFAEGGSWNWHDTGATIPRNAWTHVAVTYNAGLVTTYVNGVAVDSQSMATTTIDDVYPALNELRIGGRSNNPANQYFDGRIAEVRIWNVARSGAEISGAMNSSLTGSESGLAAYLPLDDNTGLAATDKTANGNNGTLVNGAAWSGYRINEDTTLNAVVPGVLGNDYDADGDTLTAVLVSGPANGSLTLNTNGSFVYTPNADWHGTDSFTYRAHDGTVSGNVATVTIVVNPVNDAPVLAAIGNQSVNEGSTLTFTASATDADLPAQSLTYSLDAASLALGMTINSSTGVFSWTPTEAQGGLTPSVTITVTDNGTGTLADSETFTISVGEVNTAPVLAAIGNQSVNEGATLSFTASATDADLPSQTLTYSLDAASLALGMTINSSTGAFSWTPTEAQGGLTPSVTITVTDNGTGTLTDSETFTISVGEVNTAPVLAAIGNQSVNEGATLSFTASATDADLPVQSLTYSLDAASLALGMTINSSTGAFSWTPTEAQGGLTPSVTVTVTDNGTGTLADSETFTITAADTNQAPVLAAIGNQSVNEGSTLTFTASATDADLPSQTLTYSLDAASLALGMTIDANTGVFSWTPTEAQGGLTPSVTVTVTDNGTGNLVDSETFTITVADTNQAPVLAAIGNQSVNEGATLSFTASATDADLPAQSLTYSLDAASLALGMTINSSTGAFSWTPTEAQGGLTPSVTITVADNGTGNLTDSETFTITVGDVNTAPVLAAIGNQSVNEGATLSFTASATDADLPSQTLTYSLDAASLALGMTINSSTGVFSWTPSEAQGGTAPSVTITVADNGNSNLTDSETFTITVGDTNVAPVLAAIGNQSISEGATLSFTASATDADLPAQSLTYSLDAASLALGMTIDANTGVFSWTPTEAQGGTAPSVTITVTDNGTGTLADSETFTISVGEVNDAPTITSNGGGASAGVTIAENTTAVATVTATDADGPSLTYSIAGGADAARFTIDASTGALAFVTAPNFEAATDSSADNVYDVVVQASDGALTATQSLAVGVSNVNEAPTALAPGSAAVNIQALGGTSVATLVATDPDTGDAISFSLVDDGGGRFAVDAASGQLSVASGARLDDQGGTPFVLVVRVTDAAGLTYEQPFTVSLRGLPAPLPEVPQPPLPEAPAPAPLPAPPAATAPASPTEQLSVAQPQRTPERLLLAGGLGGGASMLDERVDTDGDRAVGPVARLDVRLREDGSAFVESVSFGSGGSLDGASVALSWDEVAARSMEAVWRALAAAMPRGDAIEVEDGLGGGSGDDAPHDGLAALVLGPVQVSSVTFAAGFVWWLTRSGGLLTTLLMGIPAWRQVDLLPVLARSAEDEDDEQDDAARDGADETRPDDLDDAAVAALFDRARGAAGRPESVA